MHHNWLTGARVGEVLPCFVQDVTPGDTWRGRQLGLFRVSPLDKPAFSVLNVSVHFFFVPWRLVFDEFEDVITGVDTTTAWPTFDRSVPDAYESVAAVLGMGDATVAVSPSYNELHIRAYNKIWNEFYRNTDTQPEVALTSQNIQRSHYPATSYVGKLRTAVHR